MEEQMIIRAWSRLAAIAPRPRALWNFPAATLSRKLREYEIDVPSGDGSAKLGRHQRGPAEILSAPRSYIGDFEKMRTAKNWQVQALNLSTGGNGAGCSQRSERVCGINRREFSAAR